jgi:hypothetical protein
MALKIMLNQANLDMEIAYDEHQSYVKYKNQIEEEIKRRNALDK